MLSLTPSVSQTARLQKVQVKEKLNHCRQRSLKYRPTLDKNVYAIEESKMRTKKERCTDECKKTKGHAKQGERREIAKNITGKRRRHMKVIGAMEI